MRCQCGNLNPDNEHICNRCGRLITGEAYTTPTVERKSKKKGIIIVLAALLLVAFLGVVVLIGGGVGAYFLFGRTLFHGRDTVDAKETVTSTVTFETADTFEAIAEEIITEEIAIAETEEESVAQEIAEEPVTKEYEEPAIEEKPTVSLSVETDYPAPSFEADYMCPNSDTEYLTEDDLEGFTKWDCIYARNELYARHGRKFKDERVRAYFESRSWYNGTVDPDSFSESVFSKVEKENLAFIIAYEKKMGYK